MSRLFAVTGQNNKRNAGKRSVDTEILLREVQSKARDSDRYAMSVARMNFLHARYRRANKITDPDLLHTLGDGLAEIINVVNRDEWRKLTNVEVCALGIFHKNLGEDMGIPFDLLPSCKEGWRDGLHFAIELRDWTVQYEQKVCKPVATNDQYVRVYVDSALSSLPSFFRTALRKSLGADLDDVVRLSLNLESPGLLLSTFLALVRNSRKLGLRHLALPRPDSSAFKLVNDTPNPETKLYNFGRKSLQPWYMRPTTWSTWGPGAWLVKAVGGKVPGERGSRYFPQGYDLMTIGPEPQREKGRDEMMSDMEVIKARGAVTSSQVKVVLDGIRGVITVVMADKSVQIVVTASVFLLLAWLAVSLRVYCRTALVRSVGSDDKIMVFLLVIFTGYLMLQIYGGTHGIGRRDSEITAGEKRTMLLLWWILELLNVVSTCLLKISVGYFLLRVALDRPHIWIIRALIVGTVVFGTTYLFMVAFQCRPVPTYWEEGPRTPGKCWPSRVIYIMTIAATVINTSADFIFGALPWFIVRSMNLPIGTKIVIVCILGLAAVGSTATIVRAFYIPTLLDGEDFLYETSNFAIWSTVEPGIGIIAASIATLRPLYQMVLTKMGRSSVYRQRRDRLERQQARRNETSRMVRQAHNLDPEDGLADSDITSPHGILEINPPSHQISKQTESTVKKSSSGIGSPQLRMSLFDVDVPTSRLRLSDDIRRTMDRPPEDWLSRVKD
ncbi:integral membrane protein [Colletotrichum scovillei]|nr:integral membrane protein [Colletotrichum scovillei]